ncbi:MAG: glycosyltransferase [Bryobacteraceae bacterium]
MTISVILCTYNRCDKLYAALESVSRQILPPEIAWEVLVVDNNSSDRTGDVVAAYTKHSPDRFRYIRETRQGKSFALNTGIQEARGEVVAFMDDDVVVDENWLASLMSQMNDPEWAGAGGRIVPTWTTTPPEWMSSEDRYCLAPIVSFDLRREACWLTEAPWGTNMAFRRSMFAKYGGFRTDLGPRPGNEMRNEDTEFGLRLLGAGEKLRYEPEALVYHPVCEDRTTEDYFLAWWFDKGRADMRQFGSQERTRYSVCGIPPRKALRFIAWTLRWLVATTPSERFRRKLRVWWHAGQFVERWTLS